MKTCFDFLFQAVVFANSLFRLYFSLTGLRRKNGNAVIKLYKISRYLNPYRFSENGEKPTYSLIEYENAITFKSLRAAPYGLGYSRIWRLEMAVKNINELLTDTDLDHIKFVCGVMALPGHFVLIQPDCLKAATGRDFAFSGKNEMFGGFSFLSQADPFSAGKLAYELAVFPFLFVKWAWRRVLPESK